MLAGGLRPDLAGIVMPQTPPRTMQQLRSVTNSRPLAQLSAQVANLSKMEDSAAVQTMSSSRTTRPPIPGLTHNIKDDLLVIIAVDIAYLGNRVRQDSHSVAFVKLKGILRMHAEKQNVIKLFPHKIYLFKDKNSGLSLGFSRMVTIEQK